jgi:PAS domain-containing protein
MIDETGKLPRSVGDAPTKRKPVRRKLRASELRYRRLFEAARDGIT